MKKAYISPEFEARRIEFISDVLGDSKKENPNSQIDIDPIPGSDEDDW